MEKKKKKASDAHERKANKVKGYVYSLYTSMEILVIFFLCWEELNSMQANEWKLVSGSEVEPVVKEVPSTLADFCERQLQWI